MSESSVKFRSVVRGYDPVQVDQHMNELARAAASIWQEAGERTHQINELRDENSQLRSKAEGHSQRALELEEAIREAEAPTYAGLGDRIGAVLTLVQNEAHELRTRAGAEAANSRALADESALATRQAADAYESERRSAADDEAAENLEAARQQGDSLLDEARALARSLLQEARAQAEDLRDDAERQAVARHDAERQATARREEAEAAYERARARSAAAAVDFETTLAQRREASALEFAAQVTAAEEHLAAVRRRAEQTRSDSQRAQQEAATKVVEQVEQATARAQGLVAEAKAKAERIREHSERELASATQRHESINAQLSKVRNDLAALGSATRIDSTRLVEAAQQKEAAPEGEQPIAKEPRADLLAGDGSRAQQPGVSPTDD